MNCDRKMEGSFQLYPPRISFGHEDKDCGRSDCRKSGCYDNRHDRQDNNQGNGSGNNSSAGKNASNQGSHVHYTNSYGDQVVSGNPDSYQQPY